MKAKAAFVLTALLTMVPGLWAANPQAVLQSLKGKVEVKAPGATAWAPATEGMILSPAAVLSTGFDSSVVVVVDKTTIQVKPLTRLTIDKLVADSDNTIKTSTFLRVGSVSASVKSAEGVKQDFKVQSPYSTASVRGTEFDFDGLKLSVKEGLVAFILGRPVRESQPVEVAVEKPAEGQPAGPAATNEPTGTPSGEPSAAPAAVEQPGTSGGVTPPPANDTDFAGAPDVKGDGKAVPVAAGQKVALKLDFKNAGPSVTGGNDRKSLDQVSGKGSTEGPGSTTKAPTKGTVKLTITFD